MTDGRSGLSLPTRRDRWFRVAVGVMFGLHGVAAGSWAVRIPWVVEAHRLSSAELGGALLGAAAGGVFAMPLAARWLPAAAAMPR